MAVTYEQSMLIGSMLLAWMAWQYVAWRTGGRPPGPLLPFLLVGAYARRA